MLLKSPKAEHRLFLLSHQDSPSLFILAGTIRKGSSILFQIVPASRNS